MQIICQSMYTRKSFGLLYGCVGRCVRSSVCLWPGKCTMTEAVAIKKLSGPKLNFKNGTIDLTHGSGGRAMAQLIDQLFLVAFNNEWINQKNDQACFAVSSGRMVMATDAHVISPLFFPGGDIGSLSVHGTINDVCMSGA